MPAWCSAAPPSPRVNLLRSHRDVSTSRHRRRVPFPLKSLVLAAKISGNNRKQGSTNDEDTPEDKNNNEAFRVPGTRDLLRLIKHRQRTSKYHGVSRPRATPFAPCGLCGRCAWQLLWWGCGARPGQTHGFWASHPTKGCAQIKPLLPAS